LKCFKFVGRICNISFEHCAYVCLFRSLSNRKLDMWFEDHRGGLLEGTYVRTDTIVQYVIYKNDENDNVGTEKRKD
jgi:hypothetical protein